MGRILIGQRAECPGHSGHKAFVTVVVGAALSMSCRPPATELKYAEMSPGQGVVLGRVTARNFGEDITKRCYVGFSNSAGERVAYLSLDSTGWVMTALPVGQVKLASVACAASGFWGGSKGAWFESKEIGFVVAGGMTASYFGELTIDFFIRPGNIVSDALEPPIFKVMFPPEPNLPAGAQGTEGSIETALVEFRDRYPSESRRLKVIAVTLTGPKASTIDEAKTTNRAASAEIPEVGSEQPGESSEERRGEKSRRIQEFKSWMIAERDNSLADLRARKYLEARNRMREILVRCAEAGPSSCTASTEAVLQRDMAIIEAELRLHEEAVTSFQRAIRLKPSIRLPAEFASENARRAFNEAIVRLQRTGP